VPSGKSQIDGLVANHRVLANLDPQRIEEDDRITMRFASIEVFDQRRR
jgi:hypothetical protein